MNTAGLNCESGPYTCLMSKNNAGVSHTSCVSLPPTILRPSPERPLEISITVSCPGTMGHVAGSANKGEREVEQ